MRLKQRSSTFSEESISRRPACPTMTRYAGSGSIRGISISAAPIDARPRDSRPKTSKLRRGRILPRTVVLEKRAAQTIEIVRARSSASAGIVWPMRTALQKDDSMIVARRRLHEREQLRVREEAEREAARLQEL